MSGKYSAYPEYKDSGVEWLGEIPNHWTTAPIKYLALDKDTLFLDGDWIESKDISDNGIRYITTGNIGEGVYKEQGNSFITEETFQKLNCTEVFEGDILISRLNSPIGRACLVPNLENKIVTSVDNVIFRPDNIHNKNYLVYLFSSKDYFKHTGNQARGATMQRISRGLLGNIRIILPKPYEQTQIAAFLDHETAKIDTLIEKQQQLIELLKEKRQAVISHAVTKGLNPDAPMKDSGVEWLGEVPEHWGVSQAKYVFLFQRGHDLSSNQFISGEVPVYGSNGIIGYHNQVTTKGPSITIGRSGSVGKINKVLSDFWAHNTSLYLKWQAQNSLIDYIYYLLLAMDIESLSSGSAVGTLDRNNIHKQLLALPPLAEQLRIVEYLNSEIKRFVILTQKSQSAIKLMQERRTALISAAVTGKIDVRHPACHPMGNAENQLRENAL